MLLLVTFLLVFLWNLVPVFAPPTWIVLSYIAFNYSVSHVFILALVGAVAATAGRLVLAKLSFVLIRKKILSQKTKDNIDYIRHELEMHKRLTGGVILLYAVSPFPSSQLFMAYGLTGMKLVWIAVPFFIGRLASYLFWAYTATEISHKLAASRLQSGALFSGYFVVAQIFTLLVVYIFAKLDWKKLIQERKVGWVK